MKKSQKRTTYRTKTPSQTPARNAQKNKGRGGFSRVKRALVYSYDGLWAAWREEEGFRQAVLVFCISFVGGLIVGESFTQKIILVLPGVLCVIVELLNSAIENAIDHTSLATHPFAKKAKDMGSAAQFIALLFAMFVWGMFGYEMLAARI